MPVREWALGRRAPASPALKSVLRSSAGRRRMSADIGLQIAVNGAAGAMSGLPLPDTLAAVAGMAGAVAPRNREMEKPTSLGW